MRGYWVYYLCYIWPIISWIACEFLPIKSTKKIYFFVVYIPLSLICGMRDPSVGADTQTYVRFFGILEHLPLDSFFVMKMEAGYVLLNKIVFFFTDNGQYVLLLSGLLTILGFGVIFYRYSKNFYLSTILFVGLFSYISTFNIVRQWIASMILCWAIISLCNKKKIRFTILVLLAASIHAAALIILPMMLLYPLSDKKIILLAVFLIIFVALFDFFGLKLLYPVLSSFGKYTSYVGALHRDYSTSWGLGAFTAAMYAALGCYGIYVYRTSFMKQRSFIEQDVQILLWSSLSSIICAVIILMAYKSNIVSRLSTYFIPLIYFLIPLTIDRWRKYERVAAYMVLGLLSGVYFIHQMNALVSTGHLEPYRLCFSIM